MPCLTSLEFTLASATVATLWAVCALVVAWIARHHRFAGKTAFILTFAAMLWWLFTVGFDLASQSLECKVGWSLVAWPAITLVPLAWTFFVFDYTMNISQTRRPIRLLIYGGLPSVVSIIALTNDRTHLLYGTGTHLVTKGGTSFAIFDHGPLFYAIAAGLYIFVTSALCVLGYAFLKAESSIRPFLGVLVMITVVPLGANVAYVGWGFTVFGFDPTPFMFAVALIAFSWILMNNRMMDTEARGRDLLFYATHDPVIIMDAAGRFSGANSAAKALFENSIPARGGAIDQLKEIGPILRGLAQTGELGSGDPISFDERIYVPRALQIPSPIQTAGNLLGWSVSLVDITERERSAEALRDALDLAEAASHAKSEFLAVISHELRTPLTSLKGGLDLVLNGAVGEISDPVRNLLSIAQKNSVRLRKLIEDVLDLQKLDLEAVNLHFEDIDASEFLFETVQEYEAYAAEADVRLSVRPYDGRARVHTDPDRLKQVVGNVLSNAVKFSPRGSEVECSISVNGAALRMSIRDSGIGIPENAESRVFGRFDQVDSSSTRASGGSGLGMHITKLLIERMGGSVSYESRFGLGTTFHIDMPLSPRKPALSD